MSWLTLRTRYRGLVDKPFLEDSWWFHQTHIAKMKLGLFLYGSQWHTSKFQIEPIMKLISPNGVGEAENVSQVVKFSVISKLHSIMHSKETYLKPWEIKTISFNNAIHDRTVIWYSYRENTFNKYKNDMMIGNFEMFALLNFDISIPTSELSPSLNFSAKSHKAIHATAPCIVSGVGLCC